MSLYDVLGVSPNASDDEIKAAGRRAQKQHHPDKGGSHDEFVKVSRALRVLKDPQARAHYDRTGQETGQVDQETQDRSEAMNIVGQMFLAAVNGPTDPDYENAIAFVIRQIEANRGAARGEIRAADVTLARMQKFSKRLKRKTKKGGDFLAAVMSEQMRNQQMRKADAERKLRLFDMAEEMAKDYEYETDERPGPRMDDSPLADLVRRGTFRPPPGSWFSGS